MTQSIHISTSGGLISAAFIENIRELGTRQRGIEPESFALPWQDAPKSPAALEETIATAWELLKERWDAVRADLPMMDLSQVRARWLLPLFQLLDFDPVYLRSDTVLDEAGDLRFPLSHRGWDGESAPVLHTVIPSQGLDARTGDGRGVKTKSPHDMLQAFLNASRTDHWALLTNGIVLRLLRDYHHTFTKGYVEFDLESIFETRNYGDFRALYRMCHASRFIAPPLPGERGLGGEGEIPPLEQFYKDSLATGIKVGEDLRGQVRQAIETLGNGFLDGELIALFTGNGDPETGRQASGVKRQNESTLHARRSTLDASQTPSDLLRQYYAEILHVVYRILFLLFAEQRGMLPHAGAPLEDLYRSQYSITALRGRAEGDIPREEGFTDLWEGLQVTFRMLREGAPQLGVFGYDGMLFADGQTPLLDGPPSPARAEPPACGVPPERGKGVSRACRNSDLLRAIRALTLIEREGVLQRISYADLGVEELGSIYESLLDFTPRVSTAPEDADGRPVPANTFFLDPRGAERKTTGSYYTHPSLVNELIQSALLPVARDRLAQAGLPVVDEEAVGEATAGLLTDYAGLSDAQRAAGEAALLSLRICDPAAGSGHFLVKANNALGAELARIRSGDDYPAEEGVQAARRDVLAHCIYAVDLNPMAVELCKVSLWINASVRDKPLSFLDHHIKCGNSLIGATPELMEDGIPTDAFQAVTGDHKPTVNAIRKRNREEQGGQLPLGLQVTLIETPEDLERWRRLTLLAEEQPQAAREAYGRYTADPDYQRKKLEADFWTAIFFWPLAEGTEWAPTHGEFRRLQAEGPGALAPRLVDQIEALAERYRFFHWHLEFPEVFSDDEEGGFDVVLGNPPWERIKLQEKEFFADKDKEIASAHTPAERHKLIGKLPQTNPALHSAFIAALRDSETASHFLRNSSRFPLTSSGDINTYAVFAGLVRRIVAPKGRGGIVIPSGITTDYTYREFFQDLMDQQSLVSQYDFENREKLFPDVDSRMKFSLLTLSGNGWPCPVSDFAFFLQSVDDLMDGERHFTLSREDLALINPNSLTCPIYRSKWDAELNKAIYRQVPVLIKEGPPEENPWGVKFITMFHMTNDSSLFRTREQLEAEGLILNGNVFQRGPQKWMPVFEGKMIGMYDHRAASIELHPESVLRQQQPVLTSLAGHQDPSFVNMPYLWGPEAEGRSRTPRIWRREWFPVFKRVTAATNERTVVGAIIPWSTVSYTLYVVVCSPENQDALVCLIANLYSFVGDYVVRQKTAQPSLPMGVVYEAAFLQPATFRKPSPWDTNTPLHKWVTKRVLELTYTSWDMKSFARDCGYNGPPFQWDEERRFLLRCELDAAYFYLYGITYDSLDYVMETFPIVKRKDLQRFSRYRTKEVILEIYDRMQTAVITGRSYESPLDPPAADSRVAHRP
jgi:hypothetical protein